MWRTLIEWIKCRNSKTLTRWETSCKKQLHRELEERWHILRYMRSKRKSQSRFRNTMSIWSIWTSTSKVRDETSHRNQRWWHLRTRRCWSIRRHVNETTQNRLVKETQNSGELELSSWRTSSERSTAYQLWGGTRHSMILRWSTARTWQQAHAQLVMMASLTDPRGSRSSSVPSLRMLHTIMVMLTQSM